MEEGSVYSCHHQQRHSPRNNVDPCQEIKNHRHRRFTWTLLKDEGMEEPRNGALPWSLWGYIIRASPLEPLTPRIPILSNSPYHQPIIPFRGVGVIESWWGKKRVSSTFFPG